jgi:adenylate kinase family enzyme
VVAAGDLAGASRIVVYGVTGSGKSTLAARISAATSVPWYSVDDLTWSPGWVEVPLADQRRRIAEICAQEKWILDSAYGKWLDIPLARVELIVGLDYPRWRSFGRLCRRTVRRILDGQTVCNGNRETWGNAFNRDSLLIWHFKSFKKKRRRIRSWELDPAMPAVRRIRSPRQLRRVLPAVPDCRPVAPQPP